VICDADRRTAAEALATAELEREPIAPLTETYERLDVTDAYHVQIIGVQRRLRAGHRVCGHKVGLTSAPMQRLLGVDEPDFGHLMDDMLHAEGSTIEVERYCAPKIEPELAFCLNAPLAGPGVTVADVLRATAFVMPALEIIDSRIADWKLTLADTVADNASSAGVVLGGTATRIDAIDPRLVGVVLRRNGEIVETGASGAALGNPVAAVAWLANRLAGFGVGLAAGQIVLPGSCTRAIDVTAGTTFRAEFDLLGSVSVSFA